MLTCNCLAVRDIPVIYALAAHSSMNHCSVNFQKLVEYYIALHITMCNKQFTFPVQIVDAGEVESMYALTALPVTKNILKKS